MIADDGHLHRLRRLAAPRPELALKLLERGEGGQRRGAKAGVHLLARR